MTTPRSISSQNVASRQKKRNPSNRRTLSCYLCRKHKLKCDRQIPCQSCVRYQREDQCRENPAPSASARMAQRQVPARIAPGCLPVSPRPEGDFMLDIVSSATRYTILQFTEHFESNNHLDPAYTMLFLQSRCTLPYSMPASSVVRGNSSSPAPQSIDLKLFWKVQLVSLLPPQEACDRLVSFYIENIDHIYHAIHIPSFRRQYGAFWSLKAADIDLIWLALLLTIISLAALMSPTDHYMAMVGTEKFQGREWAHVWHQASRQALYAGDYELRPTLMQLQVFLCTQIYWLETKQHETLNSALGQAVRNAQALGLDKNRPGKDCLDTEMRRRVWWELVMADSYQAMCLGYCTLIHTSSSEVPKPVHCNDVDVTETAITPRPIEEFTDMSANIAHLEVYIVFRQIFKDNGTYTSSYEYVRSIDRQIQDVVSKFPWYFQINNALNVHSMSSRNLIIWQHILLHMGICLQRIRLNRPFLHARIGESWMVCAKAAQDIFVPYRQMRENDTAGSLKSQRFMSLGYEIYTAAVAVAAFLLVERSLPGLSSQSMIQDIQMVISDLEQIDLRPTLADGVRVLRKMLNLFEQDQGKDSQVRASLAKEIALIFGGEEFAKKYLKRSHNDVPSSITATGASQPPTIRELDLEQKDTILPSIADPSNMEMDDLNMQINGPISIDFEVALDMLSFDQWLDYPILDHNSASLDQW